MIQLTPRKGNLLIAEPSILGDLSFNRSVILIADHTEEGSVGFILNKPLEYTLNELIPEVSAEFTVFNGGPVEQDNVYFIHTSPELIPNSIEISSGIFWGGDFNTIIAAINEGQINENNVRFFLGYSGWDADQLNEELTSHSWILTENIYKSTIIEKSDATFWREKMLELGGEYSIWSNAPEDPSFN
ncbi:MAG: YqgE/AlgH family protein [Bacteroidia bacterium]|nr:YqgE/AlgH family protein [Bacteroidia bacterium]NND24950.1 YqgE/AlgH family protein [Flavobacteriaceae bacterium]MBT8278400.1 YqgE/AlgH family protein [Bacteroidia bacterium]NNK60577.1 YqgE/AlgH family protein [Flavobacteriaceae bacterium]NNL31596.1 YqgE/AlgH family protein [Flavobacteriaceae bacterium]